MKLKNDFQENENIYKNINLEEENKIQLKKEEKKNLEYCKEKIDKDKEKIINDYNEEERLKADLEFNNKINEINKNYVYKEEELEYTTKEIELKQQYLNEIQKIKSYLINPLCNNIIISAGLNKYIN